MKKFFGIAVFILFLFVNQVFAVNIRAYLTYAVFNTPTNEPYMETYLSVVGNTLKFLKNDKGAYQGAVDVSVAFYQNGLIKNAQKYTLNSPEVLDTNGVFPNFIDQQRYPLAVGVYEMEMTIMDKNKPLDKPFVVKLPLDINFNQDLVTTSTIQLLESYSPSTNTTILTKSGYNLVPYVSTFYPQNIEKIKFYTEIYNAKKVIGSEQKMLVNYYIESFETRFQLTDYSGFKKQQTNDVNILLAEFDIKSLPSGNYNLVVEARDKDNKIHAKEKCFFQRVNTRKEFSLAELNKVNIASTFVDKYNSLDTLSEYLRCLRPISALNELQYVENQLKGKDLKLMKQFFYNFWKSRNALNPEQAWLDYYLEVKKVEKLYSSMVLRGYDTDRGRTYLKYGPPDYNTSYENDPNTHPYEIWQYNSLIDKSQPYLTKQSNRKFIFYNPNSLTNKYQLLHSDAIGETSNFNWETMLQKGANGDNFGDSPLQNFNNPR